MLGSHKKEISDQLLTGPWHNTFHVLTSIKSAETESRQVREVSGSGY